MKPPPAPHRTAPEQLTPELRDLLAAELAAGNTVAECGPSVLGRSGLLVLLREPFRARPALLPPGVEYRDVNDPHWWKAEYGHAASGDLLACRF